MPTYSHGVPIELQGGSYEVPPVFLKMFPLAPHFYPIYFDQSQTFMYIGCKGGPKESTSFEACPMF